jgi:hypothetical protein
LAAQSTDAPFCTGVSESLGVVIRGSAIQRFKKRYLGLDGNTKSKNKVGRSGKDSSIACNVARFASPKPKIEKVNGVLLNPHGPTREAVGPDLASAA